MFFLRRTSTLSGIAYALVVLALSFFIGLTCALLLAQSVRNSPTRNWTRNFNAVIVGAAYTIIAVMSIAFSLKRRIAVHRKLQRISKSHRTLGRADLPKSVYRYMKQEHARACLVAYESQPKGGLQEGWGQPGSNYAGIQYRSALLRTIKDIDQVAHQVIPRHPILRPHARMLHHFRFILPLLPRDSDGLTALHYYDSAIQLVRHASRECMETEFAIGLRCADEIKTVLNDCRLEMLEESYADKNHVRADSLTS